MAYNNSVEFVGNMGKDPKLKFSNNGTAVTKFSLAVTKGKDDNKQTMWLDVTVFGELAETVAADFSKGSRVKIVGVKEPARTYEWQGETRVSDPVIADEVSAFEWKGDSGEQRKQQPQPGRGPQFDPNSEPF